VHLLFGLKTLLVSLQLKQPVLDLHVKQSGIQLSQLFKKINVKGEAVEFNLGLSLMTG
jgi:hypothetical protein